MTISTLVAESLFLDHGRTLFYGDHHTDDERGFDESEHAVKNVR